MHKTEYLAFLSFLLGFTTAEPELRAWEGFGYPRLAENGSYSGGSEVFTRNAGYFDAQDELDLSERDAMLEEQFWPRHEKQDWEEDSLNKHQPVHWLESKLQRRVQPGEMIKGIYYDDAEAVRVGPGSAITTTHEATAMFVNRGTALFIFSDGPERTVAHIARVDPSWLPSYQRDFRSQAVKAIADAKGESNNGKRGAVIYSSNVKDSSIVEKELREMYPSIEVRKKHYKYSKDMHYRFRVEPGTTAIVETEESVQGYSNLILLPEDEESSSSSGKQSPASPSRKQPLSPGKKSPPSSAGKRSASSSRKSPSRAGGKQHKH